MPSPGHHFIGGPWIQKSREYLFPWSATGRAADITWFICGKRDWRTRFPHFFGNVQTSDCTFLNCGRHLEFQAVRFLGFSLLALFSHWKLALMWNSGHFVWQRWSPIQIGWVVLSVLPLRPIGTIWMLVVPSFLLVMPPGMATRRWPLNRWVSSAYRLSFRSHQIRSAWAMRLSSLSWAFS